MKATTILLYGLFLVSARLDAAQPLFATGITTLKHSNTVLYRIDDYGTAPKAVKIGDTGQAFADVAIDPTTQRFYAETAVNPAVLFELNPTNGTASPIQSLGTNMPGLTFDRSGQLWGWGGSGGGVGLYKINKQNGVIEMFAPATNVGGTIGDLAFDTNGVLYATTSSNNLVRLDTSGGAAMFVGALTNIYGQRIRDIYGLEIDTDGTMYAGSGVYDGASFTGRAELYCVNKTNGTVTLIGTICGGDWFSLGGLSFLGNTNPPVQPTNSIYLAVEVGWKSELNRLYQVEWRTNVDLGSWSNLDRWVLGNGTTNYIFDSTRGTEKQFYRVLALP